MKTDDPLCIPVDRHDYEHDDHTEDEGFVRLAEAGPAGTGGHPDLEDRLTARPGD